MPYPIEAVLSEMQEFLKGKEAPLHRLETARSLNPFTILVGILLSARTNDKTTAVVCEKLFKVVKKPADLEKLSEKQVAQLIYPVSFYKTKARMLKRLPEALKEFKGEVPNEIDDLVKLPGVGRKTANIVLTEVFDLDAISVDIHVFRISNRLGYLKTKTPQETEFVLRKKLPIKLWKKYNPTLVAFGQLHCTPISPKCSTCPVRKYCKRVGVTKSR